MQIFIVLKVYNYNNEHIHNMNVLGYKNFMLNRGDSNCVTRTSDATK